MRRLLLFLIAPLALHAASPVLVELFTSEGCSSCPPADALLAALEKTQPVIVLSEHVDYWNRLGWADPFSSAQFTQRQSQFAKDGPYTPEMVVDGRAEFIGSDRAKALAAIAAAAQVPKASVSIALREDKLRIDIEGVPGKPDADVFVAITESGLRSNVARGENAGRELSHAGVVRRLVLAGHTKTTDFSAQIPVTLSPAWKPQNVRIVAFVEDRRSHAILGAAVTDYSSSIYTHEAIGR